MQRKTRKRGLSFVLAMVLAFGIFFALPSVPAQAAEAIPGVTSGTAYRVRHVSSGKYLEVQDASTASGANVQIFPFNAPYAAAQQWQFIYISSDGVYVLRSELNRNNALCVEKNYSTSGSNVCVKNIGSSNNANNIPAYALWRVEKNYESGYFDGTYSLYPASNVSSAELCLSVSGSNVIQATATGGTSQYKPGHAQKWTIEQVATTKSLWKYHLVGKNILTGERHMDWSGSTKYQTQFDSAVSVWNSYRSGVIRKQTGINVTDVKISDSSISNPTSTAETSPKVAGFPGKIIFYTIKMDPLTAQIKQDVALHELGHGLGLDHITNTLVSDVMNPYSRSYTALSRNDKYNYDESYKRY